jgi:hypothetical protein
MRNNLEQAPRVFVGGKDEPLPFRRKANHLELGAKRRGDV